MLQAKQTPPESITPEAPRKGIDLTLNGEHFRHTGDPKMTLLWYLRDVLHLTGTKYGCDSDQCGACTVMIDGKRALACETPMAKLAGSEVTTVEGLAGENGGLHPLQQAWIDEDAILCGYCQPGQLMAAAALLKIKPNPSDADIESLPNICRCGSYVRVRRAIKRAAKAMQGDA
ncbi:(2Fe-2S)-binding protein [Oleiagrimonas sp. C23AA]|uniref:(2Fe-2S)-binding protein n=1 Tax=Oleiagrimonas sp. C23AA TaxID=2719047 RepID=UPI001421C569|nr:(2Fe-2S)-binding protein [Oleiagrimonas sp. C23AA]NII10009.1 (2Fe-2S)-binding protein [Oleiagrimonas sp. C23AA]